MISRDAVTKLVARHFGLTIAELKAKKRTSRLVTARHIAMALARRHCHLSYPETGELLGRDHCSAWHAVHKVEAALEGAAGHEELAHAYREIESLLLLESTRFATAEAARHSGTRVRVSCEVAL